MEIAGLLWNDSTHYIDHLAPFCALLGCPLIVCEPSIAETCALFYPDLDIKYVSVRSVAKQLPEVVISCEPRLLLEASLRLEPNKHKIAWLPHGMSDKGWKEPWFEALSTEDWLLVYGNRMREILREKQILIPQISIGDFRYRYFLKHRRFYDKLAQDRLPKGQFILFAPTWEDCERNGTFFDVFPHLPKNQKIAIKLHPNTEKVYLPQIERLKGSSIHFIENFPSIYPILNQATVYIGDMSSIGYDFLCFDRPLFFVKKEKHQISTRLMQAGQQVKIDEISVLLQNLNSCRDFQLERAALRAEAFDKMSSTFLRFSAGKFLQSSSLSKA